MQRDIIAEIHDAFKDVSRDGGVSWTESVEIDMWESADKCAAARLADTDTHWSQLVDDEHWQSERGVGGFAFLDAIGFRYYLPAAMVRVARAGHDLGVVFWLSPSLPKQREWQTG